MEVARRLLVGSAVATMVGMMVVVEALVRVRAARLVEPMVKRTEVRLAKRCLKHGVAALVSLGTQMMWDAMQVLAMVMDGDDDNDDKHGLDIDWSHPTI